MNGCAVAIAASTLRGKLNLLARRTKIYTKSVDTLANPLAPVFSAISSNSMPLQDENARAPIDTQNPYLIY